MCRVCENLFFVRIKQVTWEVAKIQTPAKNDARLVAAGAATGFGG